jgi:molybdenum cofactor biosynthesis protein MoaC
MINQYGKLIDKSMVNITHKSNSLRIATAQAIVKVSSLATIAAIVEKRVPKGDAFEMAKTAGLFAAKRTSDMIPDCHPLPIEFTQINFRIEGLEIIIEVEVHTIYKTGVEVEAMHAASIVALTLYDMLKPLDKSISIQQIKLIDKKGGKSEFIKKEIVGLTAAVIVCSDSIHNGNKEDKAGKSIIEKLKSYHIEIINYSIIADDKEAIVKKLNEFTNQELDLVIFSGGTGLSPHDTTPEAIEPLLEKRIPGIEETIRAYGQERTPYAMLSRSVVGLINKTLVMALPGSTRGAAESVDAVFPHILHVFRILKVNHK